MSVKLERLSQQRLRERILDATLEVIRERGMARTRTSAIAKAAGCAEGSIYRYFTGKPELLHAVVLGRLSSLHELLLALPARAGTRTLRANLLDVVQAALSFYSDVVPLYAGLVADADLFAEQQTLSGRAQLDPRAAAQELARYLRAEQKLGRLRDDADPDTAARVLLASCLGESVAVTLRGARDAEPERSRFAEALVGLVAHELEPREGVRP